MLKIIGGNSFQVCQYLPSLPGLEEFARPEKGKKTATENSFAASQLKSDAWYVDAAVHQAKHC